MIHSWQDWNLFWDVPFRDPNIFLTLGCFLILVGAVSMSIGAAPIPRSRWVYEDKEPKTFWMTVAFWFLTGVGSIGCFIYKFY
jgi:hypothetical protein